MNPGKRITTLLTLASLLLVGFAAAAPTSSAQDLPATDDLPNVPRCVGEPGFGGGGICFYQLDTKGVCTGGTPPSIAMTLICVYEGEFGNDDAGCGNGGYWTGHDQVYVDVLSSTLGSYKLIVAAWQTCNEQDKSGWPSEAHGLSVLVTHGRHCPTPAVQATGQDCVTSSTHEIHWETDSENGCRVETYEYHMAWAGGAATEAVGPVLPTVNDVVLPVLAERYEYVYGNDHRPFMVFLDSEEYDCPAGQAPPNPGWGTFLPLVP